MSPLEPFTFFSCSGGRGVSVPVGPPRPQALSISLPLMSLQSDSRSSLHRRASLACRSECVGTARGFRVPALLARVCAGLLVVLGSGLLGTVAALAQATTSTSLTLTWTDNSSNETGFKIERSADGVSFSQLTTVGANVTTHTDGGLSFATRYTYRVSAYNSAGSSATTAAVAATTASAPAVIPPPNTAPTISDVANQTINAGSSRSSKGRSARTFVNTSPKAK